MKKLTEDIQNAIEQVSFASDFKDAIAKAAAQVAVQYIEDFKDWYDTLSPAQKCTVWPPAGSGSGQGLYNMETKDLVDKFISRAICQPKPQK